VDLILLLASGVLWTLTYVLIIRRGFLDRTFGMPLAALCANVSWEFIFAFVHPPLAYPPRGVFQAFVNGVWFFFDAIILAQLFRFWRAEFPGLSRTSFLLAFLPGLATGFGLILLVTHEFDDWTGAYAAFGQNLMMSILFICMLFGRGSVRGQSIYIALSKLLGTLLASLQFHFFSATFAGSVLLPFLYVAILVFDAAYVVAVYGQCRKERIDPWRRV
jgi:hypothetical protein